MALKTRELTGIDKASVLLMSLGASVSAKVFEQLSVSERDLLGAHIARLRHVDDVTRSRVFEEVSRIVKSGTVSESSKASENEPVEPADSGEPFKWLEKLDPDEVAKMLASERAQNMALVLAHLAPQAAAAVLSRLGESARNQAAHRLANMRKPSKEVIEAVDEVMRKRAAKTLDSALGRKSDTLMGILGNARDCVRETVAGVFTKPDPLASSGEISGPEDLVSFTDSEIRQVISLVDTADLCLALRVSSEDLKSAVLRCAPEELSLSIQRELAAPLQARLKDVELAQKRIVEVMKHLEANVDSAAIHISGNELKPIIGQ
ncbi:MAG: FliG C-terminal domain-containing protein [Armatimonadota bacterium]|nr:hypothetical protein [bacterium]